MKSNRSKLFIIWTISFGISELAHAACDQSLSPGANLASTISSAAPGSTICLSSGSYGTVTLGTFTKNPPVIIQSISPQGASLGLKAQNGANGVTFDSINFSSGGGVISGSSTKNITIKNSTFGTNQLVILTTNFNNNNILIDRNTFGAFNANGGYEGRLQITWGAGAPGATPSGVVVSNNTFGPGGCSDGIQMGARAVTVGPGNIFTGIVQGNCSAHVDAIQGYGQGYTTITGNYFTDNTVNVGFYDGGMSETISNNVFDQPHDRNYQLQLNAVGMKFTHNTFQNTLISAGAKFGNPLNSGWVVENNIFMNSDFNAAGDQPGCGSDCVMRYNLKDAQSSTTPSGVNSVLGSPTFVDGISPTNWAGYLLAPGSLGKNAASDGLDIGINSSSPTPSPSPKPSPTPSPSPLPSISPSPSSSPVPSISSTPKPAAAQSSGSTGCSQTKTNQVNASMSLPWLLPLLGLLRRRKK